MPSEFRFLLICLGATQRLDDRLITLSGIVNELTATRGEAIELAAIVGAILQPEMKDKRLDLMAWRLGQAGKRVPIPGYAGTPLILPEGLGPLVLPYAVTLRSQPTLVSGIYGFELFDRDGAFASPETLLATYMFSLTVTA